MLLRIVFVVFASFSLSGCLAFTWIDYKSTFQGAAPNSAQAGCPAMIGVQNLNAQQQTAIRDVAGTVCDIFADEEFAQIILAKDNWIESCGPRGSVPKAIAASDVLSLIRRPKENVSFHDRKPLNSIAQIDTGRNRIAIPKRWYRNWLNGTREQRGRVIETVAHELTHFVREPGDDDYPFKDGGWQRCDPNQVNLASYGVGKMASAFWLSKNP